MTKQKSGWKRRLRTELGLIFGWVEHYVETGKIGFARQKLQHAEVILRKIRICKRCGDDYYHDSSLAIRMCDDCENDFHDEAAAEETPEQRRDSELEDAHGNDR